MCSEEGFYTQHIIYLLSHFLWGCLDWIIGMDHICFIISCFAAFIEQYTLKASQALNTKLFTHAQDFTSLWRHTDHKWLYVFCIFRFNVTFSQQTQPSPPTDSSEIFPPLCWATWALCVCVVVVVLRALFTTEGGRQLSKLTVPY